MQGALGRFHRVVVGQEREHLGHVLHGARHELLERHREQEWALHRRRRLLLAAVHLHTHRERGDNLSERKQGLDECQGRGLVGGQKQTA